jgi:hypothetical protein
MQFTSDGASLIRDDSTGEVWIADVNHFTNMSYEAVVSEIDTLNAASYGGVDSWELASRRQVRKLFEAITNRQTADLFTVTHVLDDPAYYGTWGLTSTLNNNGEYYAPWVERWNDGTDRWPNWLDKGYGGQYPSDGSANPEIGAWVKTTKYPVPEPMTILLFGTGMMAMATARRRFWRS